MLVTMIITIVGLSDAISLKMLQNGEGTKLDIEVWTHR